jgi:GNAT superfamily N-acetyltransferase
MWQRWPPRRGDNDGMTDTTVDRPGDVRIVTADRSHAGAVRTLMRELAAHEGSLDVATTTEQRWRELLDHHDVTVLLAVTGDEPIGFVSAVRKLHLWSGEEIVALDDLYVRAPFRDAGVGEALMRALAGRSGRPIRWEIEEHNLPAQRFYLRLGARLHRKVIAWWHPDADVATPDLPYP